MLWCCFAVKLHKMFCGRKLPPNFHMSHNDRIFIYWWTFQLQLVICGGFFVRSSIQTSNYYYKYYEDIKHDCHYRPVADGCEDTSAKWLWHINFPEPKVTTSCCCFLWTTVQDVEMRRHWLIVSALHKSKSSLFFSTHVDTVQLTSFWPVSPVLKSEAGQVNKLVWCSAEPH